MMSAALTPNQASDQLLADEWKGPKHREKLHYKTLYFTCDEVCFKISNDQWEEVVLYSMQQNVHVIFFLRQNLLHV